MRSAFFPDIGAPAATLSTERRALGSRRAVNRFSDAFGPLRGGEEDAEQGALVAVKGDMMRESDEACLGTPRGSKKKVRDTRTKEALIRHISCY